MEIYLVNMITNPQAEKTWQHALLDCHVVTYRFHLTKTRRGIKESSNTGWEKMLIHGITKICKVLAVFKSMVIAHYFLPSSDISRIKMHMNIVDDDTSAAQFGSLI